MIALVWCANFLRAIFWCEMFFAQFLTMLTVRAKSIAKSGKSAVLPRKFVSQILASQRPFDIVDGMEPAIIAV